NQQHNHLRNVQEAYRMIAEAQIGQHALTEAWHNAEQSFALAQDGNDLCGLAYAHETLGGIAFAQQKDKLASHHYEASYKMKPVTRHGGSWGIWWDKPTNQPLLFPPLSNPL
ncbi:MAG: hypothetical protein GY805_29575, partial [Chloroflexi bacterium]|nr:hypothetical protein [Chloroflexota bacterium]